MTPNASGPSTRATLNWIELSATAFGRSFLSTSDGMSDWYAGPPNACATPVTNDSVRTSQFCATICIHVPMLEVHAPIHWTRKSRYVNADSIRVSVRVPSEGIDTVARSEER